LQFCGVQAESKLNISMIGRGGADVEQNISEEERTRSQKSETPSMLRFLFSLADHRCPRLTIHLFRLQFAVLLVRLIYLICLALLRPKCPIFGSNFASMMFPALQALDAIAVPITSCSHPCYAQTGPLHRVNSDCLVLCILC